MNVTIRPYRIEDAAAVADAVRESVQQVQPWMPWCHPQYSVRDAEEWLVAQVAALEDRKAFAFAIVSSGDQYLGGCGLNGLDAANRRANLAYWVRTTATRQGVATSAVVALRNWAFQNTDLIRLEILIAVENVASHRVAANAGAVCEGVLRNRLILHGVAHDATMFGLIRSLSS
jgi:ribosomal-protein-serine acetyltransferase